MFEALESVKKSWKNSKFIILHDDVNHLEKYSLVIPSQHVNASHISKMREISGGVIYLTVGDQLARFLELPPLKTVYLGIAKRYRVISNLYSNAEILHRLREESIAISHIDTTDGLSDEDRAITIRSFGDIADIFKNGFKTKNELINEFTSKFYTPGHVILVRAELGVLKGRLSTCEINLALSQIAKQNPSTSYVDLMSSKNGYMDKNDVSRLLHKHQWAIIRASNIIKLWRSINKVSKQDIAEPEKIRGLV